MAELEPVWIRDPPDLRSSFLDSDIGGPPGTVGNQPLGGQEVDKTFLIPLTEAGFAGADHQAHRITFNPEKVIE
jgi:hypothetical protein